jgi:hypothetical protein
MAKELQVGSDKFNYPTQGGTNYAEEATGWAEAVTNVLKTVQGPNDILPTTALILNDQSIPVEIPGLVFNPAQVRTIQVFSCYVFRQTLTEFLSESVDLKGSFNGTGWDFTQVSRGADTGVILTILPTGQVQYMSTNLADYVTGQIKYTAKTIDE